MVKRRAWLAVLPVLWLSVTLACGSAVPVNPAEATAWAGTATAGQAYRYAAGTATQYAHQILAATATEYALYSTKQSLAIAGEQAEGTRIAAQETAQHYANLLTGTVVAFDATRTAEAAQATAQANEVARQETARVADLNRQETARAYESERTLKLQIVGWTATADSNNAISTSQARSTLDAVALAAVHRQETADAASVHALETAQNGQAAIIELQITQEALLNTRMELTNAALAWAPYVGWPLLVACLLVAFWYWRRHQVIPRDAQGAAPIVRIGDRLMDMDRSVLPVLDHARPIQADREAHLRITENAQKVQALRQVSGNGKSGPSQALKLMQSPPAAAQPAASSFPNGAADWRAFVGERGPIPLGAGLDGRLIQPGVDEWPHRLFAGMTGAGKSRHGIRPYLVGALARGWVVAAIGALPPVDFKIFESHPNYHRLVLDDLAAVLPYTAAVYQEVKHRWDILDKSGASTWDRGNKLAAHIVIVFDEFAAMVDDLEPRERGEFVRYVSNISRLARKVGLHLVAGVQNPTADNIRPTIRRNMLPVAFKVTDAMASRIILEADGAERLVPPQFLARMAEVCPGVGFDPTDEQIASYLDGARVRIVDPPSFLVKLPGPGDTEPVLIDNPETVRLAESIRPEWERGVRTKTALARFLGQAPGGALWYRLDDALDYLQSKYGSSSTSSSSTQTVQNAA